MTIYHVGGFIPINRVRSIGEALEKAKHGDIIELHKHVTESVTISENLFIKGNGHTFHVKNGQVGISTSQPLRIENLTFSIEPHANALVLNDGGELHNVVTKIKGPVFDIYPSIYLIEGELKIFDSRIMKIVTEAETSTIAINTHFKSYYPETIQTQSGAERSLIKGHLEAYQCVLQNTTCWYAHIKNSVLGPHLDVENGIIRDSTFKHPSFEEKTRHNEPKHGPLRYVNDWYYLLMLSNGDVTLENVTISDRLPKKWWCIYAQHANIQVVNTRMTKGYVKHYIEDSNVTAKDTMDANLWQLERSTLSVINARLNSTLQELTAIEKLNQLIGLDNVKTHLTSLLNTIKVNSTHSVKKDYGMSHHLVFAGAPGTAKTTVARLVAQALFESGVLPENKLTEATVDTLIKGYVGQTADNVRQILDKALGGVLFIDEAYQLTVKQGQNTFNDEALSVIIRYMEDHRDQLVVIAAGYPKEMKEFIASNAGLARRFNWIDFPDYTVDELVDIFEHIRDSYEDRYLDDVSTVHNFLHTQFDALTRFYLSQPDATGHTTNGGNGGLVRNVYQSVLLHRNNRVVTTRTSNLAITMDDLKQGFDDEFKKAQNILSQN